MTLEQLKNLPAAEVAQLSQQQAVIAVAAKQEFHTQQEKAARLALAAKCHAQGFWPGDLVQVHGKYAGKQDPMAVFHGFHRSGGWLVVRLLNKDGSPSEKLTELYVNHCEARVTKA